MHIVSVIGQNGDNGLSKVDLAFEMKVSFFNSVKYDAKLIYNEYIPEDPLVRLFLVLCLIAE